MREESQHQMFRDKPVDHSKRYAVICAVLAATLAAMVYLGFEHEAAVSAVMLFVGLAIDFSTTAGHSIIGWEPKDD